MGNLIAFAGAKQSGKTTSLNYLHGYEMLGCGFIKKFFIDKNGRLVVNAVYLDGNDREFESMGVFDVFQDTQAFADYASNTFWSFIKGYNFADPLKRMAMVMFGLTREQCYGTDEQKNSLTDIRWENMLGVVADSNDWKGTWQIDDLIYREPGQMTAREFMQYFGTNIMRKIKDNVWVDLCINQIKQDNPNLALIGDCRFKNEIDAVHAAGGKVIYFTRNSESSDGHESEQAAKYIDDYDFVLDNKNMSIDKQNQAILEKVQAWGMLPKYNSGE